MTPEKQNGHEPRPKWQILRWLAALSVAVGGALYYIHGVSHQTVCEAAVANKVGKVVELCGPPGLTELLPFALVIAVLLAPDLSELGIPGLLSVKRRIGQQEARQDTLETKIMRIEQNVDQRVEQTQNFHFGDLDIMELGHKLDEKLTAMFETAISAQPAAEDEVVTSEAIVDLAPSGSEPHGPPPAEKSPVEQSNEGTATDGGHQEPDRTQSTNDTESLASLTPQLLHLVQALERYEEISRRRRVDSSARMADLTDAQLKRVDRWYELFGPELRGVKEVRNAVSHNPYAASAVELQEAIRIARRLLSLLTDGLGQANDPELLADPPD
jgi:hypothetical protein